MTEGIEGVVLSHAVSQSTRNLKASVGTLEEASEHRNDHNDETSHQTFWRVQGAACIRDLLTACITLNITTDRW